jgi:hypothetical protein
MPVDGRDDRVGEPELELVGEDATLAGLKEDATPEQFQVALDRLRQVLDRAKRGQIEPGDYPLIAALLEKEMGEL